MSHSPDHQEASSEQLPTAFGSLTQMLREGRSFSGLERNCVFLNTRGSRAPGDQTPRFANISAGSGFDFPDDARALATVDWDADGDLDVWVSNRNAPRIRFLRNNTDQRQHFIALKLQGDGIRSNRDAIGARAIVHLTDVGGEAQILTKTLRAGEGFQSQSSKWLHFGLGDAESIARVSVR